MGLKLGDVGEILEVVKEKIKVNISRGNNPCKKIFEKNLKKKKIVSFMIYSNTELSSVIG